MKRKIFGMFIPSTLFLMQKGPKMLRERNNMKIKGKGHLKKIKRNHGKIVCGRNGF